MNLNCINIGTEHSQILIIDDFSQKPHELIQYARKQFFVAGCGAYPGIQAAVPIDYRSALPSTLKELLREHIDSDVDVDLEQCAYSMITTPAHQLVLNQRIPHTDNHEPNYFAFVHYLCNESFGGTNFYRQRSTGYEQINDNRLTTYNEAVNKALRDIQASLYPPEYFIDQDDSYHLIYSAENIFNRLIIYSGANIHSGDIKKSTSLSSDPKEGRLTITGFFRISRNRS
jgi:hypothetical protein